MKTCFITFDQPLYIKARDIVGANIFDQTLIVVRLGGFHLFMSFLGCIGEIMGGSGLKEVLSLMDIPMLVQCEPILFYNRHYHC